MEVQILIVANREDIDIGEEMGIKVKERHEEHPIIFNKNDLKYAYISAQCEIFFSLEPDTSNVFCTKYTEALWIEMKEIINEKEKGYGSKKDRLQSSQRSI